MMSAAAVISSPLALPTLCITLDIDETCLDKKTHRLPPAGVDAFIKTVKEAHASGVQTQLCLSTGRAASGILQLFRAEPANWLLFNQLPLHAIAFLNGSDLFIKPEGWTNQRFLEALGESQDALPADCKAANEAYQAAMQAPLQRHGKRWHEPTVNQQMHEFLKNDGWQPCHEAECLKVLQERRSSKDQVPIETLFTKRITLMHEGQRYELDLAAVFFKNQLCVPQFTLLEATVAGKPLIARQPKDTLRGVSLPKAVMEEALGAGSSQKLVAHLDALYNTTEGKPTPCITLPQPNIKAELDASGQRYPLVFGKGSGQFTRAYLECSLSSKTAALQYWVKQHFPAAVLSLSGGDSLNDAGMLTVGRVPLAGEVVIPNKGFWVALPLPAMEARMQSELAQPLASTFGNAWAWAGDAVEAVRPPTPETLFQTLASFIRTHHPTLASLVRR